jgi:hypothetical protein
LLSTCSEDSGTPRALSSKQTELMDGRSEREFLRGIRKKERYIKVGGEPRGIA